MRTELLMLLGQGQEVEEQSIQDSHGITSLQWGIKHSIYEHQLVYWNNRLR